MESEEVIKIAWVVFAVVVSAAEIFIPGFFLLPFGIGAGVAAIAAFLGAGFGVQVAVFLVSSIASFALLRPLARRLNDAADPEGVGANRLLHQRGVVIDAIGPDDPGLARIDREDWRAEAIDGEPLDVGTRIRVVEVRGTRVMVTPEAADESADIEVGAQP